MRITVMGCSGGIGAGTRTSAMLVDDDVLLDAGTGVGDLQLAELARIRHVFLTHSHLDHIAGLPLFLDSVFESRNGEQITVYGRRETLKAVQEHLFNWVIWPDFSVLPSPEKPILRYQICDPGQAVMIGRRRFTAVDVKHTVPAQGYTISDSGRGFAVSGDTCTNRTLWPVLNSLPQLNALVIEVSFPNGQASLARESGHYTPITMAEDIEQLKHRPDIWLTAMKPGEENTILHEVKAALPQRRVEMLSRGTVLDV